MRPTLAESAKEMEGVPNTSYRTEPCELRSVGKHVCGGAVAKNWGHFLCAVASLMFADHYYNETPRMLTEWMRAKGWKP